MKKNGLEIIPDAEWLATPLRGELSLSLSEESGSVTVRLNGNWRMSNESRKSCLNELAHMKPKRIVYDCASLERWDNTLVMAVHGIDRFCLSEGIEHDVSALPEGLKKLCLLARDDAGTGRKKEAEHIGFLESLGDRTLESCKSLHEICEFIGEETLAFWRLLTRRGRMRSCDFWDQVQKAGPSALGIVSLISFLMGTIVAFIGSIPLKWMAAEIYIASVIGIGMLRLMVPIMVGVVMAGRTGAAFAAELGTMQVNEELDSLKTMGIEPMDFLVMPRSLALTCIIPVLCVYADVVGIIGGMLVGVAYMKLTAMEFYDQLITTTSIRDLLVGLFTSFVFGILVSACGCFQGIKCGRDAESVGQAATRAVVSSIVCLTVATAIITVLTTLWEI